MKCSLYTEYGIVQSLYLLWILEQVYIWPLNSSVCPINPISNTLMRSSVKKLDYLLVWAIQLSPFLVLAQLKCCRIDVATLFSSKKNFYSTCYIEFLDTYMKY